MIRKLSFAALLICGVGYRCHPPVVEHCLIDYQVGGAWCYRDGDEEEQFKSFEQLDSYIARSMDSEQKLIEWIKRNCK